MIVVEGVPLRQTLTEDALHDLRRSLSDHEIRDTGAQIATVAAAYDYEAEQTGPTTFIIRKRYSDPNDLPCVTYAEIVYGLKSMLTFIDAGLSFDVPHGKDSVDWVLYDSLTTEQKEHGPAGLRMSELTPDQRSLVNTAATAGLLHLPLKNVWELFRQLENLNDKRSVFLWMKVVGGESFGYQGPFRQNGTIRQFPLNNGFMSQVGGSYNHAVIRRVAPVASVSPITNEAGASTAIGMEAPPSLPDPTVPTDLDRFLAPGMLSGRLPSTATIGEAAERIAGADSPVASRLTVDETIADKPVCIYGQRHGDANQLVRGIATLYGLQVLTADNKNFKIAPPRARTVDRPEDAATEIFRLVPLPVWRYLLAQMTRFTQDSPRESSPDWLPDKIRKQMAAHSSDSGSFRTLQAAQSTLYLPSVRRLLALALPAVPTSASPPAPIASLNPEVLRLIALAMLSGNAAGELCLLSKFKPPRCLTDPDSLFLKIQAVIIKTGAPYSMVQITCGYKDDSGTFVNEGGFGTSRDVPKP